MTSISPFFVLPVLLGLGMLLGALALVRRDAIHPRQFAVAVLLTGAVILSPALYLLADAVAGAFGFVYTFVFVFAIVITVLLLLVVYLTLLVGQLREETVELWQEVALLRSEAGERDPRGED